MTPPCFIFLSVWSCKHLNLDLDPSTWPVMTVDQLFGSTSALNGGPHWTSHGCPERTKRGCMPLEGLYVLLARPIYRSPIWYQCTLACHQCLLLLSLGCELFITIISYIYVSTLLVTPSLSPSNPLQSMLLSLWDIYVKQLCKQVYIISERWVTPIKLVWLHIFDLEWDTHK